MVFRPLTGVVCIELGDDASAAFGARLLSDLGAEVIKVEEPVAGDADRREPPRAATDARRTGALFAYLNYGKRSITLDVARPAGAALLDELLRRSDLVICAPGAPGESGTATTMPIALERLDAATRPTLVCVSPHGLLGPRSRQPSSPF